MDAPQTVVNAMGGVEVWWAVAGGWAIDLWFGEQTREHHDAEIAIRRCDQGALRGALVMNWDLYCLDPPGTLWRPWTGPPIEPPAFQLQARSATFEFDLFAETVHDTTWRFRRDDRIVLPLERVSTLSASGIPIVRPEVQLLYMAKSTEPKNTHDFKLAAPTLDGPARGWLAEALTLTHPQHRWLQELYA